MCHRGRTAKVLRAAELVSRQEQGANAREDYVICVENLAIAQNFHGCFAVLNEAKKMTGEPTGIKRFLTALHRVGRRRGPMSKLAPLQQRHRGLTASDTSEGRRVWSRACRPSSQKEASVVDCEWVVVVRERRVADEAAADEVNGSDTRFDPATRVRSERSRALNNRPVAVPKTGRGSREQACIVIRTEEQHGSIGGRKVSVVHALERAQFLRNLALRLSMKGPRHVSLLGHDYSSIPNLTIARLQILFDVDVTAIAKEIERDL